MPSPHKGLWSHCFEVARQIRRIVSAPTAGPDYVTQTLVQAGRRQDTTAADPETDGLTPTPYLAAGCGDTSGGSDLDMVWTSEG